MTMSIASCKLSSNAWICVYLAVVLTTLCPTLYHIHSYHWVHIDESWGHVWQWWRSAGTHSHTGTYCAYNMQMASVHIYPSYYGFRGVPASLQVYALEIQPRINVRRNGASPWDINIIRHVLYQPSGSWYPIHTNCHALHGLGGILGLQSEVHLHACMI